MTFIRYESVVIQCYNIDNKIDLWTQIHCIRPNDGKWPSNIYFVTTGTQDILFIIRIMLNLTLILTYNLISCHAFSFQFTSEIRYITLGSYVSLGLPFLLSSWSLLKSLFCYFISILNSDLFICTLSFSWFYISIRDLFTCLFWYPSRPLYS